MTTKILVAIVLFLLFLFGGSYIMYSRYHGREADWLFVPLLTTFITGVVISLGFSVGALVNRFGKD